MTEHPATPPDDDAAPVAEARRYAPATARNRAPIAAVLADWLPASGRVLEIASGTGEHALHFAARFPQILWQPSEPDAALRRSIAAHRQSDGGDNLLAPVALDVTAADWPAQAVDPRPDVVFCANMIHIAPWAAAEGLIAGAGRYLAAGGGLFLYGPFKRGGGHTAPSNAAFDASLRAQDPAWGVRDLEAVTALAEAAGLTPPRIREMPANNLALWFARRAAAVPGS